MRFFSPPLKPWFRWRLANDVSMPRRSIHSVMSTRTSSTETSSPLRAAMAWRRNWVTDTPSIDSGYWKARNRPGLGPHVGGPAGDVLAVEQDGAGGDRVGGVPQQGTGQGGLAGAVGAHQRVDLAGSDREVDAAQDGAVLGRDVEVPDLEQRGRRCHH